VSGEIQCVGFGGVEGRGECIVWSDERLKLKLKPELCIEAWSGIGVWGVGGVSPTLIAIRIPIQSKRIHLCRDPNPGKNKI
jgi:hypothetical protein